MIKLYNSLCLVLLVSVAHAGEYFKHEGELNELKAKIKSYQGKLEEYVKAKEQKQSPEKMHEIIEAIKKFHHDLEVEKQRLEKVNHHVEYEHPEKGKEFKRNYQKAGIKELEDLEKKHGVNNLFDESLEKVVKSYRPDEVKLPAKADSESMCEGTHCRDSNGNVIERVKKESPPKPTKVSK